jgi:hypothetical protein
MHSEAADSPQAQSAPPVDDEKIRKVVSRLSRGHKSGGKVIERAAILAEGAASRSILDWVIAHDGRPESAQAAVAAGGLHGGRLNRGGGSAGAATPQRYVFPPGEVS